MEIKDVGAKLRRLKEILDVIGDLPGIAAFVKVFFGEEARKKFEKRFVVDLRHELLEEIGLLEENDQIVWRQRLARYEATGLEDQLVWDICKVSREVRQEWLLEWLAGQTDDEFDQWVELLRDNKLEQFLRRFAILLEQTWERMPEAEGIVIWWLGASDRVDAMTQLRQVRDRLQERAQPQGFWRRIARWVS